MLNVLFAEDETLMRKAFQKMMDTCKGRYSLAAVVTNGAQAVSYIEENHIDIVVADIKMPVMDGLELIKTLQKKKFPGVILVLSNYTDFDSVRTALTSGAADYILKINIDADILRQHLDAAADFLEKKAVSGKDTQVTYKREILDAISYIHAHFTEKITLDDVARAVRLNRSYLCRLFKRETGGNMFSYINGLRMQRAAEIIEGGDAYFSEVAQTVGVSDQFYFTRVFKKHFGMPPSEYRKKTARKR